MKIIDCLFIHQPLERNDGRRFFLQIPEGIFGIADFLERNGLEVKIINIGVEKELNPNFSIKKYLKKNKSEVIGLDLHWYVNAFNVLQLAKQINKIDNCKILLGGITASLFYKEIMENFKYIDGVIIGDGELPLLKYLQFCKGKKNISNVPNLVYRDENGKIKMNKKRFIASEEFMSKISYSNVENLKNWEKYVEIIVKPLSFKKASKKPVRSIFYLPVGKGCSVNCSYCGGSNFTHRKINNQFTPQFRSLESVLEDIKKLQEKGIEMISFAYNPPSYTGNYYEKLFKMMKENKMQLPLNFGIWGLPKKSFIDAFFSVCINEKSVLAISPESGSEKVRKINKGIFYTNSQLIRIIKYLDKKTITNSIFFTVGLPKEKEEDFEKTLKLAKYINSNFSNSICIISAVPIEPYSPMFTEPEKFGIKFYRKNFLDFYRYSRAMVKNQQIKHPLGYETEFLTEDKILQLQARAYRKFYINKKYIFSQLRKRENLNNFLRNFLRNIKIFFNILLEKENKSPFYESILNPE